MLVSLLEERRELVTGEVGGTYATSSDLRKAWEEVTNAVNSVGGMRRTIVEIKDKWMCLKCRTKKKAQALQLRRSPQQPGVDLDLLPKKEPLTAVEERIIELIGRPLVYGICPSVPIDEFTLMKSPVASPGDDAYTITDKVIVNSSPTHSGEISVKSEPGTDGSSTEMPCYSNIHDEASTSCRRPSRPTRTLLKDILERQQAMLDAWTGFQESIDMHNRIQKGILCMKYMKLKLLADERNLEVVLPPDIESLLTDTTED